MTPTTITYQSGDVDCVFSHAIFEELRTALNAVLINFEADNKAKHPQHNFLSTLGVLGWQKEMTVSPELIGEWLLGIESVEAMLAEYTPHKSISDQRFINSMEWFEHSFALLKNVFAHAYLKQEDLIITQN